MLCKSTLFGNASGYGVRRVLSSESLSLRNTHPEDDLRIETCRSDFKNFNVKFYIVHLLVND